MMKVKNFREVRLWEKCDLFAMKQEIQINTDTESFTVRYLKRHTRCNITELFKIFWSKILL